MQYKDSLDILLRECRFMPDAVELDRLIPSASRYLPPFTAISFSDNQSPRFRWGLPVVHSRRLVKRLYHLFGQLSVRAIRDPKYRENLQALTPEQLKEDPYFREVSDLLIKTLAEGQFLKLDTVLWVYISDLIGRRMCQEDGLNKLARRDFPDVFSKIVTVDEELVRLHYREPVRSASIKDRILRSLLARHDFATSCMSEIFDEVPHNPIAKAFADCRFVFTQAPDSLYAELDVREAFHLQKYRMTYEEFSGLNSVMTAVIRGILERRRASNLLPMDTYFLKTVDLEVAYQKCRRPGLAILSGEDEPRDELDQVARFLSLQEAPTRYLFFHLAELARYYIKPVERELGLTRELVRSLKDPQKMVAYEAAYSEVIQDILRWDFYNVLRRRISWVSVEQKGRFVGNRPLDRSTVPLNLAAYNEAYKRSRHGTAVFFDLIGFTARTKELTKSKERQPKRGEERAKFSLLSLAIQRLFSIRHHLETYGGIPQGFEGDAILDIFPNALQAIRYVSLFADNYQRHQSIQFRPFDRPAQNPYQDGWRVGLASGEYTVISIVGRSNEMSVDTIQERAVGHTVNRASRLNSGKKGEQIMLLGPGPGEDGELDSEVSDPLEIFRVQVNGERKLNNNGVCSFEDTFVEVFESVKSEGLPYFEPATGAGRSIAGIKPLFKHYDFALIFAEPQLGKVFLVRRLGLEPELKGLEDESCTVFEYVMLTTEGFLELFQKDQRHVSIYPAATKVKGPAQKLVPIEAGKDDLGAINIQRIAAIRSFLEDGPSIAELHRYDHQLFNESETAQWYRDGVPESFKAAEAQSAAPTTQSVAAPPSNPPLQIPGSRPIGGEGPSSDSIDVRLRAGRADPEGIAMTAVGGEQRSEEARLLLGGSIPGEGSLSAGGLATISHEQQVALDDESAFLMDPRAFESSPLTNANPGSPQTPAPAKKLSLLASLGSSNRQELPPRALASSLVSEAGQGVGSNHLSATLQGTEGAGEGQLTATLEGEGAGLDRGDITATLGGGQEAGMGQVQTALGGASSGEETIQVEARPDAGRKTSQPPSAETKAKAPVTKAKTEAQPVRKTAALEQEDLEGFAYALEMGNGAASAPTAILVGNPRQDALQDCHRYEAHSFAEGQWTLEHVLRQFVVDLAVDLDEARYHSTEQVPEGQTVYLLDAGYLLGLQG